MIRLFIADDHGLIIEGVKGYLAGTPIEVVDFATDPDLVLTSYKKLRPDVVLCDIRFGTDKENGFSVLKKILDFDANAKVIMFSQYDEDTFIQQSFDEGAKSFLMKNANAKDIAETIIEVANGKIHFTDVLAKRLAANNVFRKGRERPLNEILTEREIQPLKSLGNGMTDKEVSEAFNIHMRSVTREKAVLKEKLGITRNVDFTRLAIKHKLIDSDPQYVIKRD